MVAWGTVPDWTAAVGTVGSLVGLTIGLMQERSRRRQDEASAARERADREASQARLVSTSLRITNDSVGARLLVLVVNDSEAPIYDVEATMLQDGGLPFARWSCDRVGPHNNETGDIRPSGQAPATADVAVTFTDNNGLRWQRAAQQQPMRLLR
jgi:hypothetical protein